MKAVIEMAKEAGLVGGPVYARGLEAFAELVRANEREACAKVCDELHWQWHMGDNSGPKECAEAIRARSQE